MTRQERKTVEYVRDQLILGKLESRQDVDDAALTGRNERLVALLEVRKQTAALSIFEALDRGVVRLGSISIDISSDDESIYLAASFRRPSRLRRWASAHATATLAPERQVLMGVEVWKGKHPRPQLDAGAFLMPRRRTSG